LNPISHTVKVESHVKNDKKYDMDFDMEFKRTISINLPCGVYFIYIDPSRLLWYLKKHIPILSLHHVLLCWQLTTHWELRMCF